SALEAEAEQVHVSLAEELVDVDVVADHRTGPGQAAMERDCRVEQAVDREAARAEVDPEIAREKQVRLPGLDGNARRDPAAVEVPGAGVDVVLGHHAAL